MILQTKSPEEAPKLHDDVFRRSDVEYTNISSVNPVTGKTEVWSIPVMFMATFFQPVTVDGEKKEEFRQEANEWMEKR